MKNRHIQKQKPLIISGCSGVGKVIKNSIQGTLITSLLQQFPEVF